MIQIIKIAKELDSLLKTHTEAVVKHRVFIRLNFSIDIYVVSKDVEQFDETYFANIVKDKYGEACESWKIELIIMSVSEMNDAVYGQIFSKEDIDEGARHRLQTLVKGTERKKIQKKSPVITFYSYKGGMGRTTTLVSYAIHLAVQKRKKVFIIDCDLEAPGYLNFFDLSKHEPLNSGHVNGFVEYLCDIQFTEKPEEVNLSDYIINISSGNEEAIVDGLQNIYLMPAGNLNDALDDDTSLNRKGYIEGLSRINLADERTTRRCLTHLFNKIKEKVDPDIILVDSRTGFNDIIGTATQYFSDTVVGFFGSNSQNIPGLYTLLDNYMRSDYSLMIVNSIVAKEVGPALTKRLRNLISSYLPSELMEEQKKPIPEVMQLSRLTTLEKVGITKDRSEYINIAKGTDFADYQLIFGKLDDLFFNDDVKVQTNHNEHVDTWTIRNRILQNLKQTLASVTSFAENTPSISPSLFFFRNCMNDLFDESKFIISGYKGTGKTYLYKALAGDPEISQRLRERANIQRRFNKKGPIDLNCRLMCLDVISISNGEKSFEFASIDYDTISNPSLYFKRIWQIYTWNAILLEDDFVEIKNNSKLKEYVLPIQGDASVLRFEQMISKGISLFVDIEDDMRKINDYLKQKNIKLFLMYDQLDSRIRAQYWDKAVSPLINYWRQNWGMYSNILPKVFVRTDLYRRVMGTNTEILSANIINIEWSIEEIFAYFMKLVLAVHPEDFWTIMGRIGRTPQNPNGRYGKLIEGYKKQIKSNNNQFFRLDQSSLSPLVNTFFGTKVKSNNVDLGAPFDYFYQTLVNADRSSISLRPFINTLDKNAVERALEQLIPNRYVTSIIGSEIYATRDVRIKAANSYFDDLSRDEFSNDLKFLRDYLNSEAGINFRKKTLSEEDFTSLVEGVLTKYPCRYCKSYDEYVALLQANGIIDVRFIQGQKVWRFAPMYIYAWKLASTRYDKDLSGKAKYENPEESVG